MTRKNVPSKTRIVQHWKGWLEKRGMDLYEPACWACEVPVGLEGQSWEDAYLERAHIIPHSLGGSDSDPDNYVLLCKQCHSEAPTTNRREEFLTWVMKRENYLKRFSKQVNKNLSVFVHHHERREFDNWARKQDILQTLKDAYLNQEIATHGPSIPVSTVVSILNRKWKATPELSRFKESLPMRPRERKGGRKRIMTDAKIKMAKAMMQDKSLSINQICEELNISRATLYRYVKNNDR